MEQASDVNRQNQGKTGDTTLMSLLRHKKLRQDNEILKISILLGKGALWDASNKLGKTANDLAKKHDQKVITQLRRT